MNLFNVYQLHQLATAMTADTRITEHVGLAILQGSWAIIFSKLFSKCALLGQKVAALNLWYVDTRLDSQKLFPSI